jgi:hypothetical protein
VRQAELICANIPREEVSGKAASEEWRVSDATAVFLREELEAVDGIDVVERSTPPCVLPTIMMLPSKIRTDEGYQRVVLRLRTFESSNNSHPTPAASS